MKKSMIVFFAAVIFMSGLLAVTGCEKETGHRPGDENGMTDKSELPDSSMIRSERTDVASLDENSDGKLYQCPMDFEVISDAGGRCPKCKMDLEEYTVTEAAENFSK